jgi:hypothetical protein
MGAREGRLEGARGRGRGRMEGKGNKITTYLGRKMSWNRYLGHSPRTRYPAGGVEWLSEDAFMVVVR